MADEVLEIKTRRYIELAKQHAAMGTQTPPHILTELADLRLELGPIDQIGKLVPRNDRRKNQDGDIDFLITMVASITTRLTQIEESVWRVSAAGVIGWIAILILFCGVVIYVAQRI